MTSFPGYRKTDGQLVCVKQVPKTRVHQLIQFDTRAIPKEFDMHIKAAKCSNVVKVEYYLESLKLSDCDLHTVYRQK